MADTFIRWAAWGGGRKVMMSSGQNEDEELPNAAGFVWPTVRKLRHKERKLERRLKIFGAPSKLAQHVIWLTTFFCYIPAVGVGWSCQLSNPCQTQLVRHTLCNFHRSTNHAPFPTPFSLQAGQDGGQGQYYSLWPLWAAPPLSTLAEEILFQSSQTTFQFSPHAHTFPSCLFCIGSAVFLVNSLM